MNLVNKKFIIRYGKLNHIEVPTVIDTLCPFCGRLISFTNFSWSTPSPKVATSLSRCPACEEIASFFYVEKSEQGTLKVRELFIYPSPKIKLPLEGSKETDNLPDELQQAYLSAINVYNTHEWVATSVLCRRLLEGITKTFLPKDLHNTSLFDQLKKLPEHQDLTEPILRLAEAIRKGGNLGAHFDLDKEPDEKTASLMIELIEYLLEYLFILPKKIEHLHDSITKN